MNQAMPKFTEAAARELARFWAKERIDNILEIKVDDELSYEQSKITVKDLLRLKARAIKAAKARCSARVIVKDVKSVVREKEF